MTVADRIKNKRLELNMTQKELSDKIGTKDRSSVSKIETKGDDISMKDIVRIAGALNVTPQYLLGWEDDNISTVVKKVPDKTIRIDLDNGISIIYDPSKENDVKTAIELYQKFQKTNPDVQSAIELLLKPAKSDT